MRSPKPLVIKPEALRELDDATQAYEQVRTGLGIRFARAVNASLRSIAVSPRLYGLLRRRARFCIVKRFPFLVIFHIQRHQITVVSIVPAKSNPATWRTKP